MHIILLIQNYGYWLGGVDFKIQLIRYYFIVGLGGLRMLTFIALNFIFGC